jgi:hypothetical protein
VMYDTETSEEIGRWNYERNTIEVEWTNERMNEWTNECEWVWVSVSVW